MLARERGEAAESVRQLDALFPSAPGVIRPSLPVSASGWEELAQLRRESRSRNVEGLMLFHTVDEPDLNRWQSGLFYADSTPKGSLPTVRE